MAYDENLAVRVSAALGLQDGLVEKKMFGGVGYLLHGHMACGVHTTNLIVRVGPDAYQDALDEPNTKVFDITGRPMTGWVMVSPEGIETEEMLRVWIQRGIEFAETLPPK